MKRETHQPNSKEEKSQAEEIASTKRKIQTAEGWKRNRIKIHKAKKEKTNESSGEE